MKKSIHILIFAALLTGCAPTASVTLDPDHGEEHLESSLSSAPFSENNSESESYDKIETQPSTEYEIIATETTVTTAEIQSETVCTTTAVTNIQKEKNWDDPTESQLEAKTETAEIKDDFSETSTENVEEKSDIPIQTELPQSTENTEVMVTEPDE